MPAACRQELGEKDAGVKIKKCNSKLTECYLNMPYMLCLVGGNFISRTIKFRSAKEVAENGFWRKP